VGRQVQNNLRVQRESNFASSESGYALLLSSRAPSPACLYNLAS
jgi:hypothetical protein